MRTSFRLPDLVVPINEDESNVIDKSRFRYADGFLLGVPDVSFTGEPFLYVSLDGGVTYEVLSSNGTPVTLTPGQAIPLTFQAWTHMKIVSSSNEAAARTFQLRAYEALNLV